MCKTGKNIHNKIDAIFQFKDGLSINHTDTFNIHKWARQAMGIKGLHFSERGFFKDKLKKQIKALLDKYMSEKSRLLSGRRLFFIAMFLFRDF